MRCILPCASFLRWEACGLTKLQVIRLFVTPSQLAGEETLLDGEDYAHLVRVLRADIGQHVTLLDGAGRARSAVVSGIGRNAVQMTLGADCPLPKEPVCHITVLQAIGKGDRFEEAMQHGTEAGASAFLPIRADRGMVDISEKKLSERMRRWGRILRGAAEQSGRAAIPVLHKPASLIEALADQIAEVRLLLQPGEGRAHIGDLLPEKPSSVIIAVGPEGGWSEREINAAGEADCRQVTLGPRVLRTETAALVAISQILYHYERRS